MKIFVVVGTQEPFDRLIKAIDDWVVRNGHSDVFAQISNAPYIPKGFESTDFISPELFDQKFMEADLIVSHAGMGTIISALRHSKPIIVMPRLAKYHEHRNDHQLATARSFGKLGYVKDVYDSAGLYAALDNSKTMKPAPKIGSAASEQLLTFLKLFISKQ
ncbi:MAG: glycosyl transferase family 28 [Lentimicrobium sp.]|nr:glycosyl transferase family 28 [Lentimicrobium sp.]